MSTVIFWRDSNREQIQELLPEAVVVLPIGATEQHGPHLPTSTDLTIAEHVTVRAAQLAADAGTRPIVIAPGLPFGASAHHLSFGGTLSLRPETLLALLTDVIDSVEAQGGRRLLIVNGHGGNRGAARAAASAADARSSITVAAVDYWDAADGLAPGHAGSAETSMMMALVPDLVSPPPARTSPIDLPTIGPASYHGAWIWRGLDGYTDNPASADAAEGQRSLECSVQGVAQLIVAFAGLPN